MFEFVHTVGRALSVGRPVALVCALCLVAGRARASYMERLSSLGLTAAPENKSLQRIKELHQQLHGLHAPAPKPQRPWTREQPSGGEDEDEEFEPVLSPRPRSKRGTWRCPECTERNNMEWLVCMECGFWKCGQCGCNNASTRQTCRECRRLPSGAKPKIKAKKKKKKKAQVARSRWGGFVLPPSQRLLSSAETQRSAANEDRGRGRTRSPSLRRLWRRSHASSAPPVLVVVPWIPPNGVPNADSFHVLYGPKVEPYLDSRLAWVPPPSPPRSGSNTLGPWSV